jgi:hypothetical protein
MKLKTILIFPLAVFLIVALNTLSANATNTQLLESIKTCLPRSEVVTYQYSIAGYMNIKPSRWILVRALDKPFLAPSYSVVEIKDNSCKNYHRYPVQDISRASVPKPAIKKFTGIIKSDLAVALNLFEQHIKRQYPGKSEQELRRMGAYGMDSL